eukprot:874264-Alexandrium_andersonii.AAC.1
MAGRRGWGADSESREVATRIGRTVPCRLPERFGGGCGRSLGGLWGGLVYCFFACRCRDWGLDQC